MSQQSSCLIGPDFRSELIAKWNFLILSLHFAVKKVKIWFLVDLTIYKYNTCMSVLDKPDVRFQSDVLFESEVRLPQFVSPAKLFN